MMEIEKNKKYRLINNRTREIIDVLCYNKYSYPFDDIRYRCVCCSINLQEIIINSENVFYQKDFRKKELENYSITSLTEEPNFVEFKNVFKCFQGVKTITLIATFPLFYNSPGLDYSRYYTCDIVYLKTDNFFTEIIFCKTDKEDYSSKAAKTLKYAYIFQSEFKEELSLNRFKEEYNINYLNSHYDFDTFTTMLNVWLNL